MQGISRNVPSGAGVPTVGVDSRRESPGGIIAKWTRRLLPVYFVLIFLATILGSLSGYLKRNVLRVGDWLINYRGGFVRRGLAGELMLRLSDLSGLNPGVWVVLLQLVAYGLFFFFSYVLLRRDRGWPRLSLLVFSPILFSFQINDIPGGYRKEILYFALLAVLVWAARFLESRNFRRLFIAGLLIYPALILSHEMLAIFLPWLLVVFLFRFDLRRENVAFLGSLLLPSVLAFGLSVSNPGKDISLNAIVAPIHARGYAIEEKAGFKFLHRGLEDGHRSVVDHVEPLHFLRGYSLVLLLSILPFLLIRDRLRAVFRVRGVVFLAMTSLFGTVFLFLFAADWGRWIYIQSVSIFLVSLAVEKEEKPIRFRGGAVLWTVPILLYLLSWHIPHFGGPVLARSFRQTTVGAFFRPWAKIQNTLTRSSHQSSTATRNTQ